MASLIATAVVAIGVGAPIEIAIGIGQIGLVAVPVIAIIAWGHPRTYLGIRGASGRDYAAALLIGVSAWYLNMHLVELLSLPEGDAMRFAQLLEAPALPVALITIALLPAICEEIVFRGVLTRGLATRFRPEPAIVIAAALFSLYHLKPIQMPSTFTLGLVFGALTLRSRSVIPSMLAHLLNNAIALVVSRDEVPGLADWIAGHPGISITGAAVACAGGLVLIALPRPEPR